jgi:putative thymidine phosphorylase
MEAKCQKVDISTGGHKVAYVTRRISKDLDLHIMDRVEVVNASDPSRKCLASVQFWSDPQDRIGLCTELAEELNIRDMGFLVFKAVDKPASVSHIIDRMQGNELSGDQIADIARDVVSDSLSQVELSCFVTSATIQDLSMVELYNLTKHLAESGDTFNWDDHLVADKHCTGGVPGNRTSPIVVSIVASLGVKIPKASSRAITSPAGTADVMESVCNVAFDKYQIREIVERTNGCLIWGGGLNVAPADSRLIKVRKIINSNPEGLLISSILSKKYAMGSKYLLVDMPVGLETRYHSLGEVRHMAQKVKKIAARLGMRAQVEITFGDEPIGNGIGPNLETRDVLQVLLNRPDGPRDLRDKAIRIAGKLIDLFAPERFGPDHRPGDGFEIARECLDSGKAFSKFKEIVNAQKGDKPLDPSKFKGSSHTIEVRSLKDGQLVDYDNRVIAKVARLAGAPSNKGAGLDLYKKSGDMVRSGDLLMRIHSGSESKKKLVYDHLSVNRIYTVE